MAIKVWKEPEGYFLDMHEPSPGYPGEAHIVIVNGAGLRKCTLFSISSKGLVRSTNIDQILAAKIGIPLDTKGRIVLAPEESSGEMPRLVN